MLDTPALDLSVNGCLGISAVVNGRRLRMAYQKAVAAFEKREW